MVSSTLHASISDSAAPNPRQILSAAELLDLNQRSDLAGWLRALAHTAIIGLSGYLWGIGSQLGLLWLSLSALVGLGASLAFMFCTLHECVHRTAFANARVNDAIAWLAGVLSFYNSTFYRRYHKWHHRYTRIPGKDPELEDTEPATWAQYLWHLTGLSWWMGKVKTHYQCASGQLDHCAYISPEARREVMRSVQLQIATYLAIGLISAALGHPLFLVKYWLLPLAIGQPLLRFVLLAEHTGCTYDNNALANTRTTLTLWPLRFLMWNMPFHAEHHLYPSVPFHALPAAHQQLKDKFSRVDAGYISVNQNLVTTFEKTAQA
ncbi:MAG: fatty acid desaturase [Phormidesmis priestleyi]|uniref:Fatty acid desaturase n=1 Tax=Phormidesmis priestleyi TaxID=268141 RepID=A0A2W4XUU4_9CYAN|nr:MAG: fatty acid desaturase [Phormidesmis priestleyi]